MREAVIPADRPAPKPARRWQYALCALALCVASLAVMLGTKSVLAWFTDQDQAANVFTWGTVDIAPFEPAWTEPDEPGLPSQTCPKDPKVGNLGDTDVVVFAKVTVPVRTFQLASEDGTRKEEQTTEVFWLKTEDTPDTAGISTFHTADHPAAEGSWLLLQEDHAAEDGGTTTCLFGYPTILPPSTNTDTLRNTVAADQLEKLDSRTAPLFDKIQFRNFVEGTLEDRFTVGVEFYGIQARYLEDGDGTDLTAGCYRNGRLQADATLDKAALEKIWALYGQQAQRQGG